jgi:RNA polymerase sigma-70 factor (ECF subfamily)
VAGFEEIYLLHFKEVHKYVYSLCRNEDVADEITQEAFFKALRSIDSFDGKCKLNVWSCQIANNTYFSHIEKERKYAAFPEEYSADDGLDIVEAYIRGENVIEVHRLLHKMEEPYKEVFTLRLFGELAFSQIAELFSKTESWARVTYHRARIKLREGLS